jgi:hypothetical protein
VAFTALLPHVLLFVVQLASATNKTRIMFFMLKLFHAKIGGLGVKALY